MYLSDHPDLDAPGARTWELGKIAYQGGLQIGASYTAEETFTLSPEAFGDYVIVVTDSGGDRGTIWEGPFEDNNRLSVPSQVTTAPADLQVTSITTLPDNLSGETTQVQWTVTNLGAPVWSGTPYWTDYVYISPDAEFIRNRAAKLGQIHSQQCRATGNQRELHALQKRCCCREGSRELTTSTSSPIHSITLILDSPSPRPITIRTDASTAAIVRPIGHVYEGWVSTGRMLGYGALEQNN